MNGSGIYANVSDDYNKNQSEQTNSYINQFTESNILAPQPTFTKQTRCNNNFNENLNKTMNKNENRESIYYEANSNDIQMNKYNE